MNGNDRGHVDLDELARLPHSAVFRDVCDRFGYRQQTLPPRITRMTGTGVLIGYATENAASDLLLIGGLLADGCERYQVL